MVRGKRQKRKDRMQVTSRKGGYVGRLITYIMTQMNTARPMPTGAT